ncbi:PilW family protein [Ralstonia insidiosa]|nr:PilW family protein [Ralstonia insidiosa]
MPERADSKDPRGGYILLFSGANTTDRELELRCRSLSRTDPNSADDSQSLVRGVETLQLLYTLAPSSTSAAETVPAREIGKQDWRRVQQVHVAIVVRGDRYRTLPPSRTRSCCSHAQNLARYQRLEQKIWSTNLKIRAAITPSSPPPLPFATP